MIESSIAKRLSHPNIARVYETWEDDNNLFLVMELCEGGELLQYIANKQKKFEEDEVATIMKQCIYALAYLHENNICHRDVKPENFLL
jgi:calcium-dependent protein kinase